MRQTRSGTLLPAGVFTVAVFFIGFAGDQENKPVMTFLDTLNKGREVSLTDADFPAQSVPAPVPQAVVPDASPVVVPTVPKQEAGVVPSRFKVQILAGTQEQQVKNEKNNLAAKATGLPLSISFDAPYYKLFAGDFSQRSEAETWCVRLKDMGYKDAWIVRTASQKQR